MVPPIGWVLPSVNQNPRSDLESATIGLMFGVHQRCDKARKHQLNRRVLFSRQSVEEMGQVITELASPALKVLFEPNATKEAQRLVRIVGTHGSLYRPVCL
jgi:hypothetical protein